jgi:hypothetical protein
LSFYWIDLAKRRALDPFPKSKFLDQALAKGYAIKTLVRNPDKISQKSNQLEIVRLIYFMLKIGSRKEVI